MRYNRESNKKKILTIKIWNLRDFSCCNRRNIDDKPYGGGPGMLIMARPLKKAINVAKRVLPNDVKVIYLSPQGNKFNQESICRLSKKKSILLICGRYTGIDERIITSEVDEEWSMGDFIMTGGEIPAMAIIDAISRLIPGVVGNALSLYQDSFADNLLDCPHYTHPAVLNGLKVPDVLISGNHSEIYNWKRKQSIGRTWLKRPEILKKIRLTPIQKKLLDDFIKEYKNK